MADELIRVENLKKYFPVRGAGKKTLLKAVDGISFSIHKGETLGLVGESGCGKTTAGRTIIRLTQPTTGKIYFNQTDISRLSDKELRPFRSQMQMIFQDPYASLDPRMNVERIIQEPLLNYSNISQDEKREKVFELLEKVGLSSSHAGKYPHEFSGGQRQRIGIARALITDPQFIVCDEPISALDVSIQAQVVNMLQDLQEERGLTYLFIAHDLAMVKYISTRMGVMYLGQLVEIADSSEVYNHPLHPYTKGLMNAIPLADPRKARKRDEISIDGEIPSPLNPPKGCRFANRCKYCSEQCNHISPELKEVSPGHSVACHLY